MSNNEQTLLAFGIYLICTWVAYFCIKAFSENEEWCDFIVAALWPMAVVMFPLVWFFGLAAKLAKKFRGQS